MIRRESACRSVSLFKKIYNYYEYVTKMLTGVESVAIMCPIQIDRIIARYE